MTLFDGSYVQVLTVNNKKHEVRKAWLKLRKNWKANNANKKCQLIVFDAVIRSKLLHGLEAVHITEAIAKELDASSLEA